MNITLRKAPSSGFCTSTPIRKILNTDVKLEITVCQRLHPDWRMIPHLEIFGWTEKHQQLEQYLRMQVKIIRSVRNIWFVLSQFFFPSRLPQRKIEDIENMKVIKSENFIAFKKM